jgi:hypothetical protein
MRQVAAKVYIPSMKSLLKTLYIRWQAHAQRKLALRQSLEALMIRNVNSHRRLVLRKLLKFVMRKYQNMRQVLMQQALHERYCMYTLRVYYVKWYSFLEMRLDLDLTSNSPVSPSQQRRRASIREELWRSGDTMNQSSSGGRSPGRAPGGSARQTHGTWDRLQGSVSSVQALFDTGRRNSAGAEGSDTLHDSTAFGPRRLSVSDEL